MQTNQFDHDFSRRSMAAIFSVAGLTLSDEERALFRDSAPFGFILFGRNIDAPDQVRALVSDLKETVGWNCPILIDQEGGRVQRLKAPHWRQYEPFQTFGDTTRNDLDKALENLRFDTLRISEELSDLGINVNCSPVIDVLAPQTHDVIGDRAFSDDPGMVARLGVSVCRHYLSAGITPIIKHIPGHGRAESDSHHELPIVKASAEDLTQTDFKPFRDIAASDVGQAVWAMSAHIIYDSLDSELAASVSPEIIENTIRGDIGFDGILLSDDLDMKALDVYGDIPRRADLCLQAGCDLVLYCWADLDAMIGLAESVPKLSKNALKRLQNAANFPKVAA